MVIAKKRFLAHFLNYAKPVIPSAPWRTRNPIQYRGIAIQRISRYELMPHKNGTSCGEDGLQNSIWIKKMIRIET